MTTIPVKAYTGPTVAIDFTIRSKAGEVLGDYRGGSAYAWSGHPRPEMGERWECEILSEWTEGSCQGSHWAGGVLVRPDRLLNRSDYTGLGPLISWEVKAHG